MTLAWRLLALLLAVAGLVAGGYRWGSVATTNRIAAQQLVDERAAAAKLVREIDRGNQAQAALGAELQVQDVAYRDLERAFNDAGKLPMVATRPRAVSAGPVAVPTRAGACGGAVETPPGLPGPTRLGDGGAASGGIAVLPHDEAPDPGPVFLTAAALWMWNSTLAGRDTPAGACSAADPTSGACAAATNITVERAIANHAENARLCAEDRTRHQRLIEFITSKTP